MPPLLLRRLAAAVVRAGLMSGATLLTAHGYAVDTASIGQLSTGLGLLLASLAWSFYQKYDEHTKYEAARQLPAGATDDQVAARAREVGLGATGPLVGVLLAVAMASAAPAAGQVPGDGLNLQACAIHAPVDPRAFPATVAASGVEFAAGKDRGVRLAVDRPTMNARWADALVWPPAGFIQWTLFACVWPNTPRCECGGMHEFWSDRNGAPRVWSGAHPLEPTDDGRTDNWRGNWAYAPDRWGAMTSYKPAAGDAIGFFAVAGAVRPGSSNHPTVPERTNVVVGPLALAGVVPAAAAPGPTPTPGPTPAPGPAPGPAPTPAPAPGDPALAARVEALAGSLSETVRTVEELIGRMNAYAPLIDRANAGVDELRQRLDAAPLFTGCEVSAFGVGLRCRLR